MKIVEKILRAPLPDQLKALLEKFDVEFDASHLRKLALLADERSLTWYERRMLKRTHHKAQMELNRADTLDAAMSIVLNRGDGSDDSMFDAQRYMVGTVASGVMVPVESLYNAQFGAIGLQNVANNRAAQASQYAQAMRNHP